MPRVKAQKVRALLSRGSFRYSIHCFQSALDRIVTDEDIRRVGRTAHTVKLQLNGAFKVIGMDDSDEELTVVCRFIESESLLVITVF